MRESYYLRSVQQIPMSSSRRLYMIIRSSFLTGSRHNVKNEDLTQFFYLALFQYVGLATPARILCNET
jgi:hypothetical protein